MKSIFDYSRYKSYLKANLGASGQRTGKKSLFSKHLGCHTAFVSKVIHGDLDLNLEQAFLANSFFKHSEDESDYFLLLVHKARAGTRDLKTYYQDKIVQILEKRQDIKKRVTTTTEVSEEAANQYYSAWYYSAIHMVVSIPKYQTIEEIIKYLGLSESLVKNVLEFLLEHSLVYRENNRYHVGPAIIHLSKNSTNIHKHLSNWRTRSLQNLDHLQSKNDLHYAVTYTLSKQDALALKERFLALINENLKTIEPSPEEVLYCNIIDFFELN